VLALAIFDDIVAIVIIAVFFTADPNVGMLIVASATWALVYLFGVHATIAGVALGLAMVLGHLCRAPGGKMLGIAGGIWLGR
jgi:NhaA family Na+:H+ antiporter